MTENSFVHVWNCWPFPITLNHGCLGHCVTQGRLHLTQRSWLTGTLEVAFALPFGFISFALNVFPDFLSWFSEGKFWPSWKQGITQEIVFFTAFKYCVSVTWNVLISASDCSPYYISHPIWLHIRRTRSVFVYNEIVVWWWITQMYILLGTNAVHLSSLSKFKSWERRQYICLQKEVLPLL